MTVPHLPAVSSATHAYMLPSTPKFSYIDDGEEPRLLADDDLYNEVMRCGVPLLTVLEEMARGYRMGNPLAILAKAIGVAACAAPNASVITGIGSRPTPLNFLLCLAAPSGIGKGLSMGAPLVTIPSTGFRPATPASGEALVAEFFDTVPAADGKGTETVRHTDPVWATWGEIDAFAAKSGSTGSTLDAVLRSLWTGEATGDTSISRMKSGFGTTIEAGSYRFVMTVGAQLDRAGIFLEDDTGGTLQRLLWFPVLDDDAPVSFYDTVEHRRRLGALLGLPDNGDPPRVPPNIGVWGPRGVVDLTSERERFIDEDRGGILRGERLVDNLDTHTNNTIIRLAAVFSAWRSGVNGSGSGAVTVIDREAWWWAWCLVEISRRLREICRDVYKGKKAATARDAGRTDAERFLAREEEMHAAEDKRVEDMYLRARGRIETRRKETRKSFKNGLTNSRNRKYFEQAVQRLMVEGDMVEVSEGRAIYFVYTGKH